MPRPIATLALCCATALLAACNRHAAPEAASATAHAASAAQPAPTPAAQARTAAPAVTASAAKPQPARPASAAAPAAASTSFQVSALTLGSAIDAGYAVTAPATRFADDTPTIYASVATTGRTASAMLGARWRYLEGKGMLVNELNQAVATDGPAVTTFKVQNPDRWPAGKYSVEITLDGKPVAKQGFEIQGKK